MVDGDEDEMGQERDMRNVLYLSDGATDVFCETIVSGSVLEQIAGLSQAWVSNLSSDV